MYFQQVSAFPFTIKHLSDRALILQWPAGDMSHELSNEILAWYHALLPLKGDLITDLVPAYNSLAVFYSIHKLGNTHKTAADALMELAGALPTPAATGIEGKTVHIPVCYEPSVAPDLERLAAEKNISIEEIIALHSGPRYRVYFLGFLPGFAYLGKLPAALQVNRHEVPRQRVPAGAVAIAGYQTAVYPLESPGGWWLIGKTPLPMTDFTNPDFCRLQPGDSVIFKPISLDEYHHYKGGAV